MKKEYRIQTRDKGNTTWLNCGCFTNKREAIKGLKKCREYSTNSTCDFDKSFEYRLVESTPKVLDV